MFGVLPRKQEQNIPVLQLVADLGECVVQFAVYMPLIKFRPVGISELTPAKNTSMKILPELGRRREFLEPPRQRKAVLRYSTGPQPVNKKPRSGDMVTVPDVVHTCNVESAHRSPCYSNILLTVSVLQYTLQGTNTTGVAKVTTATGTVGADIDAIQLHLNKGEMVLVAHLMKIPRDARLAAATALRGRSRADALRFAHSGELASRNIELLAAVVGSGVVTAEHLDLIWGRLNRQLVTIPTARQDEILGHLDSAVNAHVTPWLRDMVTPVSLTELRDRVDEAILDIAPGLAAETAIAEEDSATLRRRGNTFIFTAGCETTSAAIDAGLEKRMRELLAGLRRERILTDEDERRSLPTPSQLKAQILMELLGNTPEAMTIRVNLYRATLDGIHGTGAGYVADVGWINARTADRFEDAATTVKEIPVDPAQHPESDGYPFLLQDRNYLEGRDATCRFPQCTVPANLCENDHIENSPFTNPTSNGPTSVRNGQKLCRAHHRLKTEGTWTCSTPDDGFTIDWVGPGGRSYSTHATGPLARAWQNSQGNTGDPDEPPG